MDALADAVRGCRALELAGERGSGLTAYAYEGGERVVAVLEVRGRSGLVFLNARLLTATARAVVIGWAGALCAQGSDGYYACYLEDGPTTDKPFA